MGMIKVIFLDVDGVLNSDRTARRTQSGYTFVDNRQMKNLKHIIIGTDLAPARSMSSHSISLKVMTPVFSWAVLLCANTAVVSKIAKSTITMTMALYLLSFPSPCPLPSSFACSSAGSFSGAAAGSASAVSSSSVSSGILNNRLRLCRFSVDGLDVPASHPDMACLDTNSLSASSNCVSPCFFLNSFSF